MKNIIRMLGALITLAILGLLVGCGSSEEATRESTAPPQPSATELMQKQVSTLRTENDSLKQRVNSLEQSNRSATARAAELETQLNEAKEKLAAATAPPPKPTVENPMESYREALKLFNERKYQQAADLFQACLDAGIGPERQDNCEYWLGECAYGMKKYTDAIAQFKKIFSFKISKKKDDAQVMIANSYLAMGDKVRARAEFETLIKKFPASPYVKKAKEKLERL